MSELLDAATVLGAPEEIPGSRHKELMTMSNKLWKAIPVALFVTVAAGCASTSAVDEAKAAAAAAQQAAEDAKAAAARAESTANSAKSTAEEALRVANEANASAQEANTKIDRAFKKSMYK
jgi:murein lipoprotein